MAQATSSRSPGRPKDEEKRLAIMDAARHLFGNHAYESVTMDQVASRAGVAKMTVYSHFHDKETLFEAMIRSTSDMITAVLPELPQFGGHMEEELVAFGCAFLNVLLAPEAINSMHRHVDMLARNRVLAERVYNAGPGRTRAMLAAYLSAGAGENRSSDQEIQAASDLMSLWLGDLPQQIALGLAAAITPANVAKRVRRCTRLFLRAYRQ